MKFLQHDGRGRFVEVEAPKQFHVHEQGVPSASWHVVHGLGRHPSVVVVDSAGNEWLADPRHLSVDELIVEWDFEFSGTATCS